MKLRSILRLTLNIGPQSESYNQFFLHRIKHHENERQILICFRKIDENFAKELRVKPADLPESIQSGKSVIVTCNGSIFNFFKYISLIFKIFNKKEKLVVHSHHAAVGILYLLAVIPRKGAKYVYGVHNVFHNYDMKYKFMTYLNCLFAERVSCVGYSSLHSMPKSIKLLKEHNIFAIQNGVNYQRVKDTVGNKHDYKISNEKVNLITIGKLYEQKNYPFLINMFSNLSDNYHLKIIGAGPLMGEISDIISELDINERVCFTGLIEREEVYRQLVNADLYVSCSLWEGLPVSVLEAMAVGLPVIASNIGPHIEIKEAVNSIELVDFDKSEWLKKIQNMVSLLPGERSQIGNTNRLLVKEKLSLDKMHEKYTEVYEELYK